MLKMTEDLKRIKKKYGEKMSHLCRKLFLAILEEKGLLPQMMEQYFEANKELYHDIIENHQEYMFTVFLLNKFYKKEEKLLKTNKKTKELFAEAGYDFYECHSGQEIQQFKKYYTQQERLCTFCDTRLKRYHVFFAVKKDVLDIRRENFLYPLQEDRYGTSVLSIQFSRTNPSTLSLNKSL